MLLKSTILVFLALIYGVNAQPTAGQIYKTLPQVAQCQAGELQEAEKARVLEYVNQIRAIHKLNPVTYDFAKDERAQAGALITTANANLSHTPPESWECWSQIGYNSNDKSNLYVYMSSQAILIDSKFSIDAWMIDENVPELGHRFAIINPFVSKIAFGRVDGYAKTQPAFFVSGMNLDFMDNLDGNWTGSDIDFIAYPYSFYPSQLFRNDWYMSFNVIYDKTQWWNNQNVSYDNVEVTVTNPSGTNLTVIDVETTMMGSGAIANGLRWKAPEVQEKVTYIVEVKNVMVNGQSRDFSYEFNVGGLPVSTVEVPNLLLPENEAVNQPQNVNLEWGEVEGAESYDIHLATDPNFVNTVFLQDELPETSILALNLNFNTTYYWKVRAKDGQGVSQWSEIFKFTIMNENVITQIIKPAINERLDDTNVEFEWVGLSHVTTYRLQVSPSRNFELDSIVVDEETNTNSFNLAKDILLAQKRYFWRVYTQSLGENGDWSPAWAFETGGTVSVEMIGGYSLILFPNPTSNFVTLQSSGLQFDSIELYSILGEKISDWDINQTNFDIQNLQVGTYFLRVSIGSETKTLQFVKVN